jgi:hypothetical protein
VEVVARLLKTISAADGGLRQARGSVHVEKQREVRGEPAGRDAVELVDLLDRQHRSAVALISDARIGVSVAEHHRTLGQRRAVVRRHELRPAGFVEQQLGTYVEAGMQWVEQHFPDAFAGIARSDTAGLAKRANVEPETAKPRRKQRDLRRLARAVAALEGDEQPAHAVSPTEAHSRRASE